MLQNGYRVNFTLMFEPAQTALALQAKPYFISSFIRHRYMHLRPSGGFWNFIRRLETKIPEDLRPMVERVISPQARRR
ncbi:MAG: hypothetical protein ACLVJO_04295 [[Clostridium] scindens]